MADDALGTALDQAMQLEGDGRSWSTRLSRDWEIWGPNGGYLATLALGAAGLCAELPRPASFYCQFLRSPEFDRIELDVEVLKHSRRSKALSVRMAQQGRPVLHALVRTAADAPGYEHQHVRAPDVPPPDALKSSDELWAEEQRPPFRFWDNLERRPVDQPVSPTSANRPPVVHEWVRFRPVGRFEDPFVDAARALLLLDTYGWPAAFQEDRPGHPGGGAGAGLSTQDVDFSASAGSSGQVATKTFLTSV